MLGVLLLAIGLVAACSDGDDDDSGDRRSEETSGDDDATASDASDDASSDDDGDQGDDGGGSGPRAASDPELRQAYIDAIVGSTDESSGFDAEAVECLATAFVDASGTEALEAVVTPEELAETDQSPAELGIDFPDDAGEVFYDQLSGCVDVKEMLVESLAGPDDAMAECMSDAIDEEMVRDYFVGVFVGGLADDDPALIELQERITDAIEPCAPESP
jgi:hypothetical protein